MPDEIQTEIRSNCGDLYIKTRNSYLTSLPTVCEIRIDPTIAKSVVEELSKDESLKNDLRYLIGNEVGKSNDLNPIMVQLDKLILLLENINNDKIL